MTNGNDSCWEWLGQYKEENRTPYFNYQGKKVIPYRVVYELVHGTELQRSQLILHSCDNRKCCNPAHMRIGTHEENMTDMRERERHGMPKHTVVKIKRLLDKGTQTHADIADLFGCSRQTITDIANGRTYKDVTGIE